MLNFFLYYTNNKHLYLYNNLILIYKNHYLQKKHTIQRDVRWGRLLFLSKYKRNLFSSYYLKNIRYIDLY